MEDVVRTFELEEKIREAVRNTEYCREDDIYKYLKEKYNESPLNYEVTISLYRMIARNAIRKLPNGTYFCK